MISIRDSICESGRRLYNRQLISGGEGNISVRISDYEIWCTPSGVSKGFLTPNQLVRVDLDGNVRSEGTATSELKMHLEVYRSRSDIMAVVHAHPVYACVCAASGRALDKRYLTENVITLGEVSIAAYAKPSTAEVPESIRPYLANHRAVLLAHHGALTWGKTLDEALMLMESVEAAAKVRIIMDMVGDGVEID